MWGLVEFYFPSTCQTVPQLFVLKFILSSTELLCIFIKSNLSIREWSCLPFLPFDLCFFIFLDTTNCSLNYCNSWNVWIWFLCSYSKKYVYYRGQRMPWYSCGVPWQLCGVASLLSPLHGFRGSHELEQQALHCLSHLMTCSLSNLF